MFIWPVAQVAQGLRPVASVYHLALLVVAVTTNSLRKRLTHVHNPMPAIAIQQSTHEIHTV